MSRQRNGLLDSLTSCALDAAEFLRAHDFTSCLCDEEWMHRHSTPLEWRDYTDVRQAYIEEVIHSSDPANILLSDPDGYQWRTREFEERIAKRYKAHGSVSELFADPSRRHLIYLSIPQQRLSIALEKGSSQAIASALERMEIYEAARKNEISEHSNEIAGLLRILEPCSENNVRGAVSEILLTELAGAVLDGQNSITVLDGAVRLWPNIDVQSTNDCAGRCFIDVSAGDRLIFLSRALPQRFDPYKSFQNKAELSLCLLAWTRVLSHTIASVKAFS